MYSLAVLVFVLLLVQLLTAGTLVSAQSTCRPKILCPCINNDTFRSDLNSRLENATILQMEGLVDLTSLTITKICKSTFKDKALIKLLLLSSNEIRSLPPNIFRYSPHLLTLSIAHNRVNEVSNTSFRYLTQLQYLYLFENNIHELHQNTFSGLSSLAILDLHANRLQVLDSQLFASTTSLVTLDVSRNQLETLEQGVFRQLDHLDKLSLQHNNLTSLPSGVFLSIHYSATVRCDDILGGDTCLLNYTHVTMPPSTDTVRVSTPSALVTTIPVMTSERHTAQPGNVTAQPPNATNARPGTITLPASTTGLHPGATTPSRNAATVSPSATTPSLNATTPSPSANSPCCPNTTTPCTNATTPCTNATTPCTNATTQPCTPPTSPPAKETPTQTWPSAAISLATSSFSANTTNTTTPPEAPTAAASVVTTAVAIGSSFVMLMLLALFIYRYTARARTTGVADITQAKQTDPYRGNTRSLLMAFASRITPPTTASSLYTHSHQNEDDSSTLGSACVTRENSSHSRSMTLSSACITRESSSHSRSMTLSSACITRENSSHSRSMMLSSAYTTRETSGSSQVDRAYGTPALPNDDFNPPPLLNDGYAMATATTVARQVRAPTIESEDDYSALGSAYFASENSLQSRSVTLCSPYSTRQDSPRSTSTTIPDLEMDVLGTLGADLGGRVYARPTLLNQAYASPALLNEEYASLALSLPNLVVEDAATACDSYDSVTRKTTSKVASDVDSENTTAVQKVYSSSCENITTSIYEDYGKVRCPAVQREGNRRVGPLPALPPQGLNATDSTPSGQATNAKSVTRSDSGVVRRSCSPGAAQLLRANTMAVSPTEPGPKASAIATLSELPKSLSLQSLDDPNDTYGNKSDYECYPSGKPSGPLLPFCRGVSIPASEFPFVNGHKTLAISKLASADSLYSAFPEPKSPGKTEHKDAAESKGSANMQNNSCPSHTILGKGGKLGWLNMRREPRWRGEGCKAASFRRACFAGRTGEDLR